MNFKPAPKAFGGVESGMQRAERQAQTARAPRRSTLDQSWAAASPESVRGRLLEAAGEVFAEVGFRNATIREICRRAAVNIAAVNYHFGDKEQLYAEVLHYSQQKAFEKYPPLLDVAKNAPPEEKLHAFVRSFLLRIFDNPEDVRGTAWFGKMMSREMVEPTVALNALLETRIRPLAGLLGGIVAEILGGAACRRPKIQGRRHAVPPDDEKVRLCCFSVVSQCVFFHHCRTMICRLFPEQKLDASAVAELAGHVTRFSLAAMKHLANAKEKKLGRAKNTKKTTPKAFGVSTLRHPRGLRANHSK